MAGVRRLSVEMTRLGAVVEKALGTRTVAQGARDAGMRYQALWDILHGNSVNPQAVQIHGLITLGASYEDIMEAIQKDRLARAAHPEEETG